MHDEHIQPEYVALALGSNLGDRVTNLRAAVVALEVLVSITKKSAIYETPPAYVVDQPSFLNAAVLGVPKLDPIALLQAIKKLEIYLGRKDSFRNGPRLIDIDIIFYGARRLSVTDLTLPHPRMAEREFVLRPLADIAPEWRHPETDVSVKMMLDALKEETARPIADIL